MLEDFGMDGIGGSDLLEEGDHWECQECGKRFVSRHRLYFHYRNQHEDPGTCDCCCKTFSSQVKLNIHMRNVHGPKREPKYLCQECGNKFMHSNNFKRHLKVHEAPQSQGRRGRLGRPVGASCARVVVQCISTSGR